ncbi:MAG: hypothetical protein H0W83_10300 [Planctomycetes bacterium]|nr:hypothetical protein [Planctomycetota bacterium]
MTTCPFPATDRDRSAIWEMLVPRDTAAFVDGDWDRVAGDFHEGGFEGIHAHRSHDPDRWTLAYPRLADYRDDWLRMHRDLGVLPLVHITPLGFIEAMTSLERIDISGDRALAHKKFRDERVLGDGRVARTSQQSLYRLHRLAGGWKIVGFVGYLPLET